MTEAETKLGISEVGETNTKRGKSSLADHPAAFVQELKAPSERVCEA
jgi:hypothetical protein